jgi:hypothetical protein
MRTRFAYILCLFALLAGTQAIATEKPTGTPVTGEQLKAMFTAPDGVFMEGRSPNGMRWYTFFLRSGQSFIQVKHRGGVLQDTGSWRVEGDTLCFKWAIIREGAEACHMHYKVGENAYQAWNGEGKLLNSYSLRP